MAREFRERCAFTFFYIIFLRERNLNIILYVKKGITQYYILRIKELFLYCIILYCNYFYTVNFKDN